MTLSKIERLKDNRRADLYADGKFILRVHLDILTKFGLRQGDDLSPDTLETLKASAEFALAKDKALQILARRSRSEKELRNQLRVKEFHPQTINRVIAHLHEMGFLDDRKFAELYTNYMLSRKPSGKIYLQKELRNKGINSVTIKEVLDETLKDNKEEEHALSAATSFLDRIHSSSKQIDQKKVKQRIASSLSRRGFNFSTIHRILRKLVGNSIPGISSDESDLNG